MPYFGVGIGGEWDEVELELSVLFYADDTMLAAESAASLQIMVDIFVGVCEAYGQKVSVAKSKVMVVERGDRAIEHCIRIQVGGEELEEVEMFSYLGSRENKAGTVDDEIEQRCKVMVHSYWADARQIYHRYTIPLRARLKVFLAKVTAVGVYGCQAWNIRHKHVKQLESTYYQLLRRLLGFRVYDLVSYEMVIQKGKEFGCQIIPLELHIYMYQIRYLGHVNRRENSNLHKIMMWARVAAGVPIHPMQRVAHRNNYAKAMEALDISTEDWEENSLSRAAWRHSINVEGVDYFMKGWLEERRLKSMARREKRRWENARSEDHQALGAGWRRQLLGSQDGTEDLEEVGMETDEGLGTGEDNMEEVDLESESDSGWITEDDNESLAGKDQNESDILLMPVRQEVLTPVRGGHSLLGETQIIVQKSGNEVEGGRTSNLPMVEEVETEGSTKYDSGGQSREKNTADERLTPVMSVAYRRRNRPDPKARKRRRSRNQKVNT